MNFKIIYTTLCFLTLICIHIDESMAQTNEGGIANINERILNKLEGLNTKINDLERKVYQGKEIDPSNEVQEVDNNNYRTEADHERRLLELEEKTRSVEGVMEELSYLKEQINKLTQQNADLLEKIENLNQKPVLSEEVIKEDNPEEIVEQYPIYPGMSNSELNKNEDQSTVKVLAKIDTTNGNDEIVKQTINNEETKLLIEDEKEIKNDNQKVAIIKPSKEPQEIYQRAYNMLSKGNYEAAEVAFIKFIKDFSDHSLTSNAYYWLGETFYVRKNYIQAAQNFAAGYKKFPKGSKASAQLLKLGISLYALNKNKEACSTFAKLNKEFSDLSLSISSRVNTFKEKLDCK
ncbi:MAG: tol-pal system protein YbgF [Alphaproteobacteria bacterium]|nr:tol-pal system protein YbgF [Alphaproteobacteria bacterium]